MFTYLNHKTFISNNINHVSLICCHIWLPASFIQSVVWEGLILKLMSLLGQRQKSEWAYERHTSGDFIHQLNTPSSHFYPSIILLFLLWTLFLWRPADLLAASRSTLQNSCTLASGIICIHVAMHNNKLCPYWTGFRGGAGVNVWTLSNKCLFFLQQ